MGEDYLKDTSRVSLRSAREMAECRRLCTDDGQPLCSNRHSGPDAAKSANLWPHQRTAIALAAAYVCSDKTLDVGGTEAALIKMPTGTGKSGRRGRYRALPSDRTARSRTYSQDSLGRSAQRATSPSDLRATSATTVQPPQTWSDGSIEPCPGRASAPQCPAAEAPDAIARQRADGACRNAPSPLTKS